MIRSQKDRCAYFLATVFVAAAFNGATSGTAAADQCVGQGSGTSCAAQDDHKPAGTGSGRKIG